MSEAEARPLSREDAIDLALLSVAAGSVAGVLLIWKLWR